MSGSTPPAQVAPTATAAPPPPVAENSNLWRGIVSIAVMGAFGVVVGLTMTHAVPESATTQQVVGTLTSLATIVVGYWMGSSAGSTAKSAQMAAMTPVVPTPAATPTTSRAVPP